jgi:hypothetical protein
MAELLVTQGADEPGQHAVDGRCGACGVLAKRSAPGLPPAGWVSIRIDAEVRLSCSLACGVAVLDALAASTPMALGPPPLPTRRPRRGEPD